jgi:predicted GNAT family acetyltransferase
MEPDIDSAVVRDNVAESRYEVAVGGQVAVLEYAREVDRITLIHSEVPEALEGHGVAGILAKTALDEARRQGLAVIPDCRYVAAYIRRHPEYADLALANSHGSPKMPD